MQNLISPQRVVSELRTAVGDTLRIDEETVRPEISCVADLGAESLDFLDINYRMEQTFGIRMARHFFLVHAEELFGEGTVFDDSGHLTERGAALLRRRYGEHAIGDEPSAMDMDEVPTLITVQAIADTVLDILATLPDRCSCGASAFATTDGTHIVCARCTRAADFTDGDQLIRDWLADIGRETHAS